MYIKIFTFHAPEKLRDRYSENNRDSNLYIRKTISNRLNNTNTVLFLIISIACYYVSGGWLCTLKWNEIDKNKQNSLSWSMEL